MCKKILLFSFFIMAINFSIGSAQQNILPEIPDNFEAISFLGKGISSPEPSASALEKLETAKVKYMDYPMDPENVIWYGRRLAYAGKIRESIKIFSEGILDFPKDPRFYRHRGHRYISIRDLDRAIADFKKAGELIEGKPNEVEQDGAPNQFGIPVSTLHHNIWYHLGLSYYLKHDWENAKIAYDKAYSVARNGDNLASISNWRYSILRRMGKTHDEAKIVLEPITDDIKILENHNYHKLDLFYKGEISIEEMLEIPMENSEVAADASLIYGVANWYLYNGEEKKAYELMEYLVGKENIWGAFGYLASEADLAAAAQ